MAPPVDPKRRRLPQAQRPAARRERMHRFVFENQSEKDRFGIFDPFLRLMFAFAVILAAVLWAGTFVDAATGFSRSLALALAIGGVLGIVIGGVLLYHAIWRPPSERELLLQMAKEDDEARRLRATLEGHGGGSKRG